MPLGLFVLALLELVVVLGLAAAGYYLWDRRRHRGVAGAGERFQPTDEIFLDPSTGRRMRVYYDRHTGQRQYRDDPGDPPG